MPDGHLLPKCRHAFGFRIILCMQTGLAPPRLASTAVAARILLRAALTAWRAGFEDFACGSSGCGWKRSEKLRIAPLWSLASTGSRTPAADAERKHSQGLRAPNASVGGAILGEYKAIRHAQGVSCFHGIFGIPLMASAKTCFLWKAAWAPRIPFFAFSACSASMSSRLHTGGGGGGKYTPPVAVDI